MSRVAKAAMCGAIFVLAAGLVSAREAEMVGLSQVVRGVQTRDKVVALTYDDGPHATYTPQILRILKRYDIKATFFMIGKQMEEHPDIVKEVMNDGHVILNHTYEHPKSLETESEPQVLQEISRCQQLIERDTGSDLRLFRPPSGLANDATLRIIGKAGYTTVLWSVCADHHDAPTPELMAERVLNQIGPGGIILAHDGYYPGRWKDVAATPLIVQGLLKRGYRFVTIPELLEKGHALQTIAWNPANVPAAPSPKQHRTESPR